MAYKVKIEVDGYQCLRCGHRWVPRNVDVEPTICPKCKSPYWNKARRGRVT
jgi:predicted Zn-ribbon and HTH transcriptional regulator